MSDANGENFSISINAKQRVREPVRWFGTEMERKLCAHDSKGHWAECTTAFLIKRMKEEIKELEKAVKEKRVPAIISECADVANFVMMIADNADEKRWKKMEAILLKERTSARVTR